MVSLLFLGMAAAAGARPVSAHDVPDRMFDRAIELVIEPDRIRVTYHLSLTQLTLAEELLAIVGPGGLSGIGPNERMERYAREMGPWLTRGLILQLDGNAHDLHFARAHHRMEDHPRFHWELEAPRTADEGTVHRVSLEDANFFLEKGRVRIAIRAADTCELQHSSAPPRLDEVETKPTWAMTPEEQDASRRAQAEWIDRTNAGVSEEKIPMARHDTPRSSQDSPAAPDGERGKADSSYRSDGLTGLLDRWSESFYVMLLSLAFFFGAAHAMTPGHGKTMVAAYLIGERGTLRHAVGLGLTTSLTHTSSVLAVALLLWLIGPAIQSQIHTGFSLLSGLLVALLGAGLLIARLRRFVGAHGTGPSRAEIRCASGAGPVPAQQAPGPEWVGLVTLGVSGGIVPCWDAVVLLLIATAQGQIERAVFLLVSFSAGLASALVLVGILAVKLRGFLSSRMGSGRIVQMLPLISATAILLVGLYLCLSTWQQCPASDSLATPAVERTVGP